MKTQSILTGLGLTFLTVISTLIFNGVSAYSHGENPDRVTFSCRQVHDPTSGEKIPATVVWIPKDQKNVRLIGWKSNYFDKVMNNEERCKIVTEKFQTFYDAQKLNYLTTGESNGYPIICGVAKSGDPCNGESQLFTLKPHNNPQMVRQDLTAILEFKSSEMLMQSSGDEVYIPFDKLLESSPVYEEK